MSEDAEQLRERTMGELLSRLSRETTLLVRQEVELAKTELAESGRRVGAGAVQLGAATVAALGALGAFTAFAILALALVMPAWVAALVVTVVYGIVAVVLGQSGRKKIVDATPLAPATVETVKEDVQWAKTRTKSGAR